MDVDLGRFTNAELHRLRAEALADGRRAEAAALAAEVAARQARFWTGEVLDTYDDSLRPLGPKERGLVHLDGDWHRSFHCWFVSPARQAIVVQRRSLAKATYPGALDATVAGHYRAGEDLAGVCREAEEEVGLSVDPRELIPLGRAIDTARHGVLIDREVADVHLYRTDVPLADLRPDPEEVAEVLDLPLEAALALFRGHVPDAPAWALRPGAQAPRRVRVAAAEFTRHHDRYYARLALQAHRAARGLPPLEI